MPNDESKTCRICAGQITRWGTALEMHFGLRDPFDYVACTDCGCLQIATIPHELERYYPPNYYAHVGRADQQGDFPRASRLRRAWTDLRLREGSSWRTLTRPVAGRRYARFEWFHRTGIRRDDPILDVGCGSGRLLKNLHRDGFSDLTGIDPQLSIPSPPPIAQAGPSIRPRLLRESLDVHARESRGGTYELVMAHHSFEHLEDPRAAFDSFSRLVQTGGWLLLRIPLADSWACRHYGVDWVQLDAPRHLYLHTRDSVHRLASDAGFRIEAIVDDSGPFQIWGSELIRRGVPLVDARKGRRRLRAPEAGWAARLQARRLRSESQGDQACFYLQRLGA